MRRRSYDLALVVAVAAVAVILTALESSDVALRVIPALVLVLVAPGYALREALFPRPDADGPERILLTLGLSVAAAALGGLALNLTPWGLRATPWAALLGGLTLAASAVAFARRRGQPAAGPARRAPRLRLRDGLMFVLAALLVVVALREAQTEAIRRQSVGFTQLWVLPAGPADRAAVQLGVVSQEPALTRYRLRLEVDGRLVREWQSIALRPSEQWEQTIALPAGRGSEKVEALLYRLDAPETTYRRGVLWLDDASG